jgi:hypothetical protein
MSIPTRRELAVELATRNDRCAATDEQGVCLKAKQHVGPCEYEPTISIVPF